MRHMRMAIAFALALMAVQFSWFPAFAVEFGTRAEAVAMAKRAQAKYQTEGYEALYKSINSGGKEFNDRDLYAFVDDLNGINRANAVQPALPGKNIYDLKDQDGKFLVQEMIALARSAGHGWVDYRWLNPTTKTIEDKSAYIERIGPDAFVGVGIYKNEQPNENTVAIISGSPNSDDTYLRMAYDLAEVLNDGENLRVLPIAGIGGPRNIRDVLDLKGIDVGLTQTSILNNFRRSNERMGKTDNRIVYIAKLFNEEVHLVARSNITSVAQLKGLKVNLDAKGSGTNYSMRDIFKTLGIEIEEVSLSQVEALEKVRSGEIAATAVIAGKPVRSMSLLVAKDGLHFVPLPYPNAFLADYLPATLTHDDYPDLVPAGQSVDTVAVGAVLISRNWPKTNVDRYRRIQRFVEIFFPKIDEFRKPPRHRKWREVNIAATLPGWPRFEAAQAWIDAHRSVPQAAAGQLPEPGQTAATVSPRPASASIGTAGAPRDVTALYQEFLRWRRQQR